MTDHPPEGVFVCDLHAIPAEARAAHQSDVEALFAQVTAIEELPNGYAYRLPAESETLRLAAAFIANERLCCPFFGFELRLEPRSAALWLALTGPEGVKPFIAAEIGMPGSNDVTA